MRETQRWSDGWWICHVVTEYLPSSARKDIMSQTKKPKKTSQGPLSAPSRIKTTVKAIQAAASTPKCKVLGDKTNAGDGSAKKKVTKKRQTGASKPSTGASCVTVIPKEKKRKLNANPYGNLGIVEGPAKKRRLV